jgi:hypothetical protein
MYLEVSVGEAIDKYCILELKSSRIQDTEKLFQIRKELDALKECKNILTKIDSVYYRMLYYVNEKIWDMTDVIKGMLPENPEFSKISNEIFEFNQKRFRLKKLFNELIKSNLQEQKSYSNSHCVIYIKSEDDFFSNLATINYLSIQYDTVSFRTNDIDINIIKQIYNTTNYMYDYIGDATILNIEDIKISSDLVPIFEFQPLSYKISGMLGDFIQSLSVVYEKFRETGRKGIVYISENPFAFRFPIQKTHMDLTPIFDLQPYIHSFYIHTDQPYDIDGDIWRQSPHLFKAEWHIVYKSTYGIEWGRRPWLLLPNNTKFNDKIVVSTSVNRSPPKIAVLHEIYNENKDAMIFVGESKEEYDHFRRLIDIDIPFIKVDSLYDKMVAIRSAKYFIGNLSSALTIANGCHTPRMALLWGGGELDDVHNRPTIWDNYRAV